jgi:hypothetical protein
VITSGGKRNPAKPDLNAGTRRERRRIDQACLILLFTDASDPLKEKGFTLLHDARTEPWGQTVARLQSSEGAIIGLSFAPFMHP